MFEGDLGSPLAVLASAKDEAVSLRHPYVGTEHLLLGLLRQPSSQAARVLNAHVDVESVRVRSARSLVWATKSPLANFL
jgi:ATP-dependent Clp protease ATP-binding subunit ClpA